MSLDAFVRVLESPARGLSAEERLILMGIADSAGGDGPWVAWLEGADDEIVRRTWARVSPARYRLLMRGLLKRGFLAIFHSRRGSTILLVTPRALGETRPLPRQIDYLGARYERVSEGGMDEPATDE